MIVGIILAVLLIAGVCGFIGNLSMDAGDHRRAAQQEALMSTRSRNAKRATAHAERAQAHMFIADQKDQGRM